MKSLRLRSWLFLVAIVVAILALALACDGDVESRRLALEEHFDAAIERSDLAAASLIVEELRDIFRPGTESSLRLARMFVRVGKLSEALWLLEEAERTFPGDTDVRLGIAETALLVAASDRAFEVLARIPATDPQHAYALLLRSRAQLGLGDLAASLTTLREARESYPEGVELAVELINGLIEAEDLEAALGVIAEARSFDELPDDQRNWFELTEAGILTRRMEIEGALAVLDALLERDPRNSAAWMQKVELLLGQGEVEQARTILGAAIEKHSDVLDLYALMVKVQLARGDLEAAHSAQEQMLERVKDVETRISLAGLLHGSGQFEKALDMIRGAEPSKSHSLAARIAFLQATFLLDAGRPEEARIHVDDFREKFSGDPQGELLRARLELAAGDVATAVGRLRLAVSKVDRADAQHWLGVALEKSGDQAGAEYRFGLALRRDQRQVASYIGLTRSLEHRGAWRELVGVALRWVAIEPDSPAAFDALVMGLLAGRKASEAEEVLRTYASRFPGLLAPVVGLSTSLREQGRADEALVELDAAAARFAGENSWLAERAIVLQLLGRGGEALAALEELFAAGIEDAALERAHAYLLFMSGRDRDAEAAVERALELQPGNPTPLRMLGNFLSLRGDFPGAERAYQRYLLRRAGDPLVHAHLGDALARQGRRVAAIEAYREAIRLDDISLPARNNLALMLQQEGRIDEALVAAQAAYARADTQPIVMDTLGWLFVAKGLPKRAVALLSKARLLAPESLETRYHLAIAHREAGQLVEARELLAELRASLDSDHELYAKVAEVAASLP